jgi:hypothetical protein
MIRQGTSGSAPCGKAHAGHRSSARGLLRQIQPNYHNSGIAGACIVNYVIGMTSKSTNAAALDDSKTDPSSIAFNAVVAGPSNQEFQYWIERYGLPAQHVKLLIPLIQQNPTRFESALSWGRLRRLA